MRPKAATVGEYLSSASSDEARASLQRLRKIIKEEVPSAEERIGYGIPSYYLKKSYLCGIAAFKNHCSFFPGATVEAFADRLGDYKIARGNHSIQTNPRPAGGFGERDLEGETAYVKVAELSDLHSEYVTVCRITDKEWSHL